MTLQIDFSAQTSERLAAAARIRGIEPAALVEKLVADHLPAAEPPRDAKIAFAPPGQAAQRLRARLSAEATDDPAAIRKAQHVLDDMKRSMNEERLRSGAEPIF